MYKKRKNAKIPFTDSVSFYGSEGFSVLYYLLLYIKYKNISKQTYND